MKNQRVCQFNLKESVNMRRAALWFLSFLVSAIGLMAPTGAGVAATATAFAVSASPPGVTMLDVVPEAGGFVAVKAQPRYATPDGLNLFTNEADTLGKSNCYDDCLGDWKAFAPPVGFKPIPNWSVIRRKDGTQQVAFFGKPLYASAKAQSEGPWHLASFAPIKDVVLPTQIKIREIFSASGQAFTDINGRTLYIFAKDKANQSVCYDACAATWPPAQAGALILPVGDFSIIERKDGIRQWTYKGKPLYLYAHDQGEGDVNGLNVSSDWSVAKIVDYFTPSAVKIYRDPRHGEIFVTANGQTLYALDKFRFTIGQYNTKRSSSLRGTQPSAAALQKAAVFKCDDVCAQVWKPLIAGQNDVPSSLWTIVARDDGARQWAYLGYPLYTNVNDKKPGDTFGHDEFNITDGINALYWRVALP